MVQDKAFWRFARPSAVLLAVLVGCESMDWFKAKPPAEEPPPRVRDVRAEHPLLAGTIAERTLITDASGQPLRGFGLVVGLNGKGSSDCPTAVREYLVDFLAKQVGPQSGDRRPRLTPDELIDSPDTAVVEVWGHVPAGAVKGTRFDLQVKALPGTTTKSLEGGLLLPTQLRFFDVSASGQGLFAGNVLAEGGGPVFVNPFVTRPEKDTEADVRQGFVLGGGQATVPRPSRLMLLDPNYADARAIERRVNERFGAKPKAATAESRGYIVLDTPPDLAPRPQLFRQIVVHMYLDGSPANTDRRLQQLNQLALAHEENNEALALTWEGIGRAAIPHIQPLYSNADQALRFYAARTGLRLGDMTAVAAVGSVAESGSHSLQLLAIRELGECRSPQAPLRLVPLLSVADQELRVAAYEALLQQGHPVIQSTRFPHILDPTQLNFSLDLVDCSGPPLIYVRRTRVPRIAVFGRSLMLQPPVFYNHAEDALTVHTVEGGDDVQMFMKRGGKLTEPILVPPRISDVVTALASLPTKNDAGHLRGLGLPYSRVVQILAELSRTQALAAPIVLEQATLTELLGPEPVPERPEAADEAEPPPPSPERGESAERPEAPTSQVSP